METVPCGAYKGQIVSKDEVNMVPFCCEAIALDPAAGMRFSSELGLPPEQRTRQVGYIFENKCDKLIELGECPALEDSRGTVFQSS